MTSLEQTKRALAMAEERGGKAGLNCIAEIDPTALQQAEEYDRSAGAQLLNGTPVLIKDNIDVAGLHTTAGSLALADNIARRDAPVIGNLRRNGAVILGKTNMTEFANYTTTGMPGGYSSRGGQVVHAADPGLSPSGSSSGSAVAVAAGIVPMAVGTDTSFSIIACAQQNGICGLKPLLGALPSDGIIPIAGTLDSAGPMALCFSDALRLYSAMRSEPLPDIQAAPAAEMRIAVNTANRSAVSEGQTDFLNRTVSLLKRCGACVEEIDQPPAAAQRIIMQYEFMPHLEAYLRRSDARLRTLREIVEEYERNPETMMKYGIAHLKAALSDTPGGLASPAYLAAMEQRREAITDARKNLAGYDAVVMTGPTNIMHFCGLPSATVRSAAVNKHGVARCLILYGLDEIRLYRAALALERLMQGPLWDQV